MHIYPIDLNDFHKKYVVTAPEDLNINKIIEKFLNLAKIDINKYAGRLFKNILEAFFAEVEDIRMIYEKYYAMEYDSVEEYMYKKMLMEKEEIEYIYSKLKEGEIFYFTDLYYTSDPNYNNLFEYEDENLLLKINNLLERI
ncbi:hypothetical protein [Natronospora cellulosivora (SeqCode)]